MPLKIKIILTDENGNDYVGETTLSPLPRKVKGKIIKAKVVSPAKLAERVDLDFGLSVYAFMKKIGATRRSGPIKITALVAYLSKGDVNVIVKTTDIKNRWQRMKSMLGKWNTFYYTPAKQNAWIHPVSTGSYKIRKEGLEILQKKI